MLILLSLFFHSLVLDTADERIPDRSQDNYNISLINLNHDSFIQIDETYKNVYITDIPINVTISLIAQEMIIKFGNYSQDNKITITMPSIKSVSFFFQSNSNISLYNKFPSSLLLSKIYNFHLNENVVVNLLPSSWKSIQPKMYIKNSTNTIYNVDTDFIPFVFNDGFKTATAVMNIKKKSVKFMRDFFYHSLTINAEKPDTNIYIPSCSVHILKSNDVIFNFKFFDIKYFETVVENSKIYIDKLTITDGMLKCQSITAKHVEITANVYKSAFIVAESFVFDSFHLSIVDQIDKCPIVQSNSPTDWITSKLHVINSTIKSPVKFSAYCDENKNIFGVELDEYDLPYFIRNIFITETYYEETMKNSIVISKDKLNEVRNILFYSQTTLHIVILDRYTDIIEIIDFSNFTADLNVYSTFASDFPRVIVSGKNTMQILLKNVTLVNNNHQIISAQLLNFDNINMSNTINLIAEKISITTNIPFKFNILKSDLLILHIDTSTTYVINQTLLTFDDCSINLNNSTQVNAYVRAKNPNLIVTSNTLKKINILAYNSLSFSSNFPLDAAYFGFYTVHQVTNYLPKSLITNGTYQIPNLITIPENAELTFMHAGEITSQIKRKLELKKLKLGYSSTLLKSNISYKTKEFDVQTTSNTVITGLEAEILNIYPECLCTIESISGLKEINVNYSISALGYIHLRELNLANDNLTVNLNNFDPNDQFYYDFDWNNLSVNFLCIDNFSFDQINLNYEFKSSHWDFNGESRLFDMIVRKDANKSCLSIVHRQKNEKVEHVKSYTALYIGIAVAGCVCLFVIISLTVLCRIKTKRIQSFTADSPSESIFSQFI